MTAVRSLLGQTRFRLWAMRTWAAINAVETPTDPPRVHASGPDPDRILLFGSDIFVGRGVLSHEVAFPGYVARAIARETGRGVDVHVDAQPSLTIEQAAAAARLLDLARYDAVVIDIGFTDAIAGTTPAQWAAQLEVLLQVMTSGVSASARVFLIASPDPTIVPLFRSRGGRRIAQAYRDFDVRSKDIVSHFQRATFVPFPMERETQTDRLHTARSFERFANTLAPPLIAHLEVEFLEGAPRSDPIPSEERRQDSVDRLGILDTVPEERFDRIVAQAQRVFQTEYAAFNIIDRDRRWSKSVVGPGTPTGERANEFCNTAIHGHSALVVGDALEDPRFRDNVLVTGEPHIRFYAGYPIEAPDGERIGTLCVYDPSPRALRGLEETLLRDLAVKIERELWSMPSMKARILKT